MSIQVGAMWDDGFGRTYMELTNPKQAREIYDDQRMWWLRRKNPEGQDYPEDFIQMVISQQTPDYGRPSHEALAAFLGDLVEEKQRRGESEISILEIGAANGPTARHMQKFHPDMTLGYFGMEAFPALTENAQQAFPQHAFVVGTAEEFAELTPETAGRDRFDVFIASLVLCMMIPNVAYSVLKKASEFTDVILCRDYLTNKGGEISRTRPVLFEMAPGHDHMIFANPFETMLRGLGYSRIDYIFDESAAPERRGMGSFLARRMRDGAK